MADVCPNVVHFCRIRVTKLDAVGAVAAGPDNSYVSDKTIECQITPVIQTGTERTLQGGCGCVAATSQDPNVLKRWQLDLKLSAMEPALKSMLLGVDLITSGGDNVGINGVAQTDCGFEPSLVAFEAWADAYTDDAPDPTRPFVYFVWPATYWQFAQMTIGNDYLVPSLQAFSRPNPSWFTGPYDDLGVTFSVDQWAIVQVSDDPPTAECGFQTVTPGT